MSEEEKTETLVAKAKARLDALKTQEGRDALKGKLKEGASRLRSKSGIAWSLGVLVVVVLVTVFLVRSCSTQTPAPVPSDSQQSVAKKDAAPKSSSNQTVPAPNVSQQNVAKKDAAPKPDGSANLTKVGKKKTSPKTFLGFTFGAKADGFKDVKRKQYSESDWAKEIYIYTTTQGLRKKFRLFKSASLKFTTKDKRLYKIELQTEAKDLVGFNPIAVLREAQYCAAMIERKYGERFNLENSVVLFSEKATFSEEEVFPKTYTSLFEDTKYYIGPHAFYHGFFDNTIEIKCCCEYFNYHYGVWISAMDHNIIAEDGGRTKDVPLDADDDEDDL